MPLDKKRQLFSGAAVLTGTHDLMSRIMRHILGKAPEFNVVHEPLNAEPTLGYAAVGAVHWYEYYNDRRYEEMRDRLKGFMFGQGVANGTFGRIAQIRSRKDPLRVGKYAFTNMKFALQPRRAIFKDPFLAFSGHSLQKHDGLAIVLCLRHPCAFAESLKRRGGGFDFNELANQPDLMNAVSAGDAEDIYRFTKDKKPLIEQATLLWRTVYGFAAANYLNHPKTVFIRQEDLAANPVGEVDRIFSVVEATRTRQVDAFLDASLNAKAPTDFDRKGGSYVHRNAKETTEKWRKRLSAEEIARIMEMAGATASVYGYGDGA